jgi:hypothetical protein
MRLSVEPPLLAGFFMRGRMGGNMALGQHQKMQLLVGSLVFQAAAITLAFCLPFGFDHPSSLGLDFGHFLLLLVAYVIALLIGVIAAHVRRKYMLAFIQLATPCVIAILGFAGIINF